MREGSADGTILVVALCGAESRSGSILIDRKFHDGMIGFVERLNLPFVCLLPHLTSEEASRAMDMIEVPLRILPYRVDFLASPFVTTQNLRVVERSLGGTTLAYLGALDALNLAVADSCRRRGIPYVIVSEYSMRTDLQIMRATTPSLLRRAIRETRIRLGRRRRFRTIAGAAEIHANGYPTFEEFAAMNPHRLLFFDTRARADDIISECELRRRLALRSDRPARLIYSGRYHPMKGALDVVKVGIELDRRGFDFQLDMYGTGPLRERLASLVRNTNTSGKITIHDSIPFRPDLQSVTKQADLFVCCHVQGDPSCTYLESFACGVPIVGYANEMWSPLCRDSGAGEVVSKGDYKALAQAAIQLLGASDLDARSLRARYFAIEHTMEVAWTQRTSRLAILAGRN
jgi:colanic acid/amylovoran biosynthesis glycosyltransferase